MSLVRLMSEKELLLNGDFSKKGKVIKYVTLDHNKNLKLIKHILKVVLQKMRCCLGFRFGFELK